MNMKWTISNAMRNRSGERLDLTCHPGARELSTPHA